MTFIQKINPINKEEEKRKFFFDPQYNPQFEYAEEIAPEELKKYGDVSFEYFDLAKSILDKVIAKYGSESRYLEEVEGRLLTKEEVVEAIHKYLKELGLENTLTMNFSKDFVARTSVDGNVINIRLPIDYREHAFEGILNHELATHYLKNLNEQLQPWYQKRDEFKLINHIQTEEGLAVLHYYQSMKEKYLWIQSLYYYAVCKGEVLSFANLHKHLEKYIDDRDRRWKICLRVKRGMRDTSQNGSMSKDQAYLNGVIKVIRWLRANNCDTAALYVGKIDIDDLPKLKKIEKIVPARYLPKFLDPLNEYVESLLNIMHANGLQDVV